MSSLREVLTNRSRFRMSSGIIKRKHATDISEEDDISKENLSVTPKPPVRTKKQKMSKEPPMKVVYLML